MAEEDKTTLSAAQVDAVLPTLEGWTRSEAVLARTFVFPNFSEITRTVKKLKRTIFSEFTGQPSPAPHLAIHHAMAHTSHQ